MWLWWLLPILIVAGLFWVLARTRRNGGSERESPEEILKRRYASGEIDREEYKRRLEDLRR
jgi:putative membrane protein